MSVTIREVAELAGVSPSTVSRVISGSEKISEDTKNKVKLAMEKLRYRPNFIARSLARKATRIIGLTIPYQRSGYIRNSFFAQVMHGICTAAQLNGYLITINYALEEDQELVLIKELAEAKWIDGMILLTSYDSDASATYLKESGIPFSIIGRPEDVRSQLWVDNDNFSASYSITNLLLNKGLKKVALLGGPDKYTFSIDRRDGYHAALKMRGFEFDDSLVLKMPDFSEESGYQGAKLLFDASGVDAIVCTDDKLAVGASQFVSEHKLKCAITGFNNSSQARYANPAITTVDLNAITIGKKACEILINYLENNIISNALVETKIIERESTEI